MDDNIVVFAFVVVGLVLSPGYGIESLTLSRNNVDPSSLLDILESILDANSNPRTHLCRINAILSSQLRTDFFYSVFVVDVVPLPTVTAVVVGLGVRTAVVAVRTAAVADRTDAAVVTVFGPYDEACPR